MIYRIYPVADTTITDQYILPLTTRMTSSNTGLAEELQVFKSPPVSGAVGIIATSSLGRSLLQFDFTAFGQLTASGDIPTSGISFRLHLSHKTSADTLPSSYAMTIAPVSTSWNEGIGMDVEDFDDIGYANWNNPVQGANWAMSGGDYIFTTTASAYFSSGYEDIDVDITPIVDLWLSGAIPNYGLGIMMTASVESDLNLGNYYLKKFYSRHTQWLDRAPWIEARVTDFVRDDRTNIFWSRTGTLYLYNIVGGLYQSLPAGNLYVNIQDSSGTLLALTASQGLPGIYSCSFALPTGTYSGSIFYDQWGSGSFAFSTGTFTIAPNLPLQVVNQNLLTARVRNLQDEYLPEDAPVFEVVFRKKNHASPVLQTASLGPVTPYIVENAWYAIENDATRERVIPFGTGSQQQTKLSYGANGNTFRLFMTNLHSSNVYRMVFLVKEQGRAQVIDPGIRFKIQ